MHPNAAASEQCRSELQEITAQGFGLGVATGGSQAQKSSQGGPDRDQLPLHLGPGYRAGLVPVPGGKEPFDLLKSPFSQGASPSLALGELLKISLQMRPAELALVRVRYIIGAPAITMKNALEGFANQLLEGLPSSGAGYHEDGGQSGHRDPQPTADPGASINSLTSGHICPKLVS